MNPKQIATLVHNTVHECNEFFVTQGWATKGWTPMVRISFSQHRNRSWGGRRHGRPFISLALRRFVGQDKADFNEYPSFRHDSEIGSVQGNTIKAIKALVVHEMCHAIQYSAPAQAFATGGIVTNDVKGHGTLWKTAYRLARNALVNHDNHTLPVTTKAPVQAKAVKAEATNTMKRQEALEWIRNLKSAGVTNRTIIEMLVDKYSFKRTTATTYTYSV